jgi:hypothetical protein
MIKGIAVFLLGFSLYITNKMLACSSYAAGYLGVIVQGIGIGIVLSEYLISIDIEL